MRTLLLGESDFLGVLRSSFALLSKIDQKKIKRVTAAQTLLSFLDLLGIPLIGLVASLAVTGINSKTPRGLTDSLLKFVKLESLSFQTQTAILATLALFVFIMRTVLSMFFIRKTLFFLGRCGAGISADLFSKIIARPISEIGKHSSQQYVYFLTAGVETLTVRIIGSSVTLIADIALLVFILTALFYVNLLMTIVSIFIVGAMSWVLHRMTTSRSKILGMNHASLDISSRESLIDALIAFREIVVRGRTKYYEDNFRKFRSEASGALAEYNFMPYMGKYVIETSIMLAAFLIAGAQFLFTDALNAITTLSIFMAAGSRLAPAVLRIQQGFVRINNSWGVADSTLSLIEEVKFVKSINREIREFSNSHQGFVPNIELSHVAFRYPGSSAQTLEDINLKITSGESIALVGPSGSGKSTLVDLMSGVLIPDSGKLSISGLSPHEAIARWPGAIGYVPQDVYLASGTVAQNVALGYSEQEFELDAVWEALEKAQLSEFIRTLENGLSTYLGDRGVKLSGGQKQRLGIARALLTRPQILFLDEATSALDSQTEYDVSESINGLKGQVTLVCIAHRLSTARRADRVIYLAGGRVLAQGSFDEVRKMVPDFQKQSELMDLTR